MKRVRPVSLHVSGRVGVGLRRSNVPARHRPPTSQGLIAHTKQVARGDYQCNLPMQIHSKFINKIKEANQSVAGVALATEAVSTSDAALNTNDKTGKGGKTTKKKKPPTATNKVFELAATPQILDVSNPETLPDTAHDLAYTFLSQMLPHQHPDSQKSIQKGKNNKDSFIHVQDSTFSGVSVAPQGFLGLRLNDNFISKRLTPFLVQNDAPSLLLYESDMHLITPHNPYDDMSFTSSQPDSEPHKTHSISASEQTFDDQALCLSNDTNTFAVPIPAYPRVITIDYASPNIAKEMHVGHIRTTVIGDTLARIAEFSGNTVQRLNHIGDWGTQFGMLLCHFNSLIEQGQDMSKLNVSDLQVLYQASKKRFDQEIDFQINAKQYVVRLQGGDPECMAIWKRFCQLSSNEFHKIFVRLQIDPRLLERGESFYQPFLPDVVDELLQNGIAIERDGAILVPPKAWRDDPEGFEQAALQAVADKEQHDAKVQGKSVPLAASTMPVADEAAAGDDDDAAAAVGSIPGSIVLRKSDGGFTYGATDLASIRLRLLGQHCWHNRELHKPAWFENDLRYKNVESDLLPADWALYVVDSGQSVHFQRVFESAYSAGWVERARTEAATRKAVYFEQLQDKLQQKHPQLQKMATTSLLLDPSDSSRLVDGLQNVSQSLTESTSVSSAFDSHSQQQSIPDESQSKPHIRIEHVGFGVVLGEDNKRLRTRSGKQIKLAELLDESVSRSSTIIEQLAANALVEESSTISVQKRRRQRLLQSPVIQSQLSEAIGYGSIKYADLSKNRIGDYVFSFDKMLDMQGDTAGYLLYAHARLFNLLQRVGISQRYEDLIQSIHSQNDPQNIFASLTDYDFQFLPQVISSRQNNMASQFDSILDIVLHKPHLLSKINASLEPLISQLSSQHDPLIPQYRHLEQLLRDQHQNHNYVEQYHRTLVSSTIAQYASPYALDERNIIYKRSQVNNDSIWRSQQTKSNSNQISQVQNSYIENIVNGIDSIDPVYGISFASGVSESNLQQKQQQAQPPSDAIYSSLPQIALDTSAERALALHIVQFHDALLSTLGQLGPHIMCDYTMSLSSAFSKFYQDCPVLPKEGMENDVERPQSSLTHFNTQDSRVLLTHATTVTLQRCLDLIGIQPTKLM